MTGESVSINGISSAQRRKIFYGSAMGNLLDWYDFSVYGSLGVVLSKEFFPKSNIIAALLATFLVFALGYLLDQQEDYSSAILETSLADVLPTL